MLPHLKRQKHHALPICQCLPTPLPGTQVSPCLPVGDVTLHSGKLSAGGVEIIQKIVFKVILHQKVSQYNTIRL